MIDSADVTMQVGVGNRLSPHVNEAFRLSLLLLPPNNRRQLHILLKLMSKILQNQDLIVLKPLNESCLKIYLIKLFWPTIFRCPVEFACDLEEVLGIRFVSIFLDQYENLLGSNWDHLMAQVKYLREGTENEDASFCQKISM